MSIEKKVLNTKQVTMLSDMTLVEIADLIDKMKMQVSVLDEMNRKLREALAKETKKNLDDEDLREKYERLLNENAMLKSEISRLIMPEDPPKNRPNISDVLKKFGKVLD